MGCTIAGCGKALPNLEITNEALSRIVETNDEWIVERTGIHARRIAIEESATDLASDAALHALNAAGFSSDSLDLIICMTITPDSIIPSQASLVRERIGASNAIAFDANAACTGCVYGIALAESMMIASHTPGTSAARNTVNRALVIGVERLSRLVNWDDRATCVLFGDGSGAVVLEWSDKRPGILSFFLKNTDDTDRTLSCKSRLADPTVFDKRGIVNNEQQEFTLAFDKNHFINMEGQRVFKFATSSIVEAVNETLARANRSIDDVTLIVPHQANERIIKYAAKKLGLPMDRFQVSIANVGNTSAASALSALADAYAEQRIQTDDLVILVGFGGGLTSGALLFEA